MKRVRLDQDIKPLSEFRANLASSVAQVRETGRPLVITDRGRSAAVIIGVREYEALLDKLELLEDIQEAESQLNEGQIMVHAVAKRRVLDSLHT